MARHTPVGAIDMHVDVGVTRSKDPTVTIRIEPNDVNQFVLKMEPNFSFFMKVRVVWKPVPLIENVERRPLRRAVDQKGEGLIDVDPKFRDKLYDVALQACLVADRGRDSDSVPGAYLRI